MKDVPNKNRSHQTKTQFIKAMVSAGLTWFGVKTKHYSLIQRT